MQYKLINPVIEGSFDNVFNEKTPMKAAHKCWLKLSELLSSDVPQFAFTLKEMKGGKLYHYKVSEKEDSKDEKINFTLSELDLNLDDKQLSRLNDLDKEVEQKGGLKKKQKGGRCGNYLTSTSTYCNGFKKIDVTAYHPINYWWYWPHMYSLDVVYMPSFIAPMVPYVTILM